VADPVLRRAARWATLVAVPLALLAGVASYAALGGASDPDAASPPTVTPDTRTPAPASAPVTVPAPRLTGRPGVVCRALLSQLPDSLRDHPRRPVTAGAEQNAAYGDPPITVACGAPAASFPATDLVYALDRVCWHAANTPAGTVWTTVDREVPVRVTVPAAYEEPGQWVIELSAPVIATVPSARSDRVPAGCNP
jgi:hypothetical protein